MSRYVIFDNVYGKDYLLTVNWESREEAELELELLLRGYPEKHFWRKRLVIKEQETRAKPPRKSIFSIIEQEMAEKERLKNYYANNLAGDIY